METRWITQKDSECGDVEKTIFLCLIYVGKLVVSIVVIEKPKRQRGRSLSVTALAALAALLACGKCEGRSSNDFECLASSLADVPCVF